MWVWVWVWVGVYALWCVCLRGGEGGGEYDRVGAGGIINIK